MTESFVSKSFQSVTRLLFYIVITTLISACGGGGYSGTPQNSISDNNGNSSTVGDSDDTNNDDSDDDSNSIIQLTLRWEPPTYYVNGEAISTGEVESYDILWGNDANNLAILTTITDTSIQRYTIENLRNGEYWFAVVAQTIYGTESDYSNLIKKVIN